MNGYPCTDATPPHLIYVLYKVMAQRKTKCINIRALRLENYKSPPIEKGKQAANTTIPQSTPKLPRHHPGEHFLKGPVPFSWLAKAARCGGRALHVGIILWYRAGLERSPTIRIPTVGSPCVRLKPERKEQRIKGSRRGGARICCSGHRAKPCHYSFRRTSKF